MCIQVKWLQLNIAELFKMYLSDTWTFLAERIYKFATWWKVDYFLIEVSITEPQGSSITNSVTQSITAQSELIA